MGRKVVGSLESASADSNAHDGNYWVRTRIAEPVLLKISPRRHGATSRGNSGCPEENNNERVSDDVM